MPIPIAGQIADMTKAETLVGTPTEDGYVRMTFDAFVKSELVHLFSGMDDVKDGSNSAGASFSSITGFTEWVSHSLPAITIGWDWQMIAIQGKASLVQLGEPGSNLMFVCQHGKDVGVEATMQLLADWIKVFSWQTETLKAISMQESPVNFDSC